MIVKLWKLKGKKNINCSVIVDVKEYLTRHLLDQLW